jgi:hypothetical protein
VPRKRDLKHGFFMNENLADLDPLTRLLFQATWCIADRNGRLENRPRQIKALCLPFDDHDVEAALGDLEAAGFIVRYEADSQSLIEIVNFDKHQRPHPKEEEKYPANPHGYRKPNLSAAEPLQVTVEPNPRARERSELKTQSGKSKSGKDLELVVAREPLDEILFDLREVWPKGRNFPSDHNRQREAIFDQQDHLPDEPAEVARLYLDAHGWGAHNTEGCPNLSLWIADRRWEAPLPSASNTTGEVKPEFAHMDEGITRA